MLLHSVKPVKKEFTRHLDLPWRTRHPISPEFNQVDYKGCRDSNPYIPYSQLEEFFQGMCAKGIGSKQWVMLVLFLSTDSYLCRDYLYGALA